MADEIGRAMQKAGGAASATGVEFEKVSSWIATVSAKTREGAETVGNSIKSIMTRYSSLKEKGFTSDDGTQVNQVAKALDTVGIKMMDAQGNFRNFGDVMDELGDKWDKLDDKHRQYIATTMAGTTQGSRFMNLMNGYKDSVDLYNQSLNSAGTTQQKYNLWLQGTEAHLNTLKATAESAWMKIFNSDLMKVSIDGLTKLVGGLDSLISKFGAFPTVVGTAMASLTMFTKNNPLTAFKLDKEQFDVSKGFGENFKNMSGANGMFKTLKNDIGEVSGKLKELNAENKMLKDASGKSVPMMTKLSGGLNAVKTSAIGAKVEMIALQAGVVAVNMAIGMFVGAAISLAINKFMEYKNKADDMRKANEDLMNSCKQNVQTNNSNIQSLTEMENEYDALSKKTNLTADEQKKLNDMTNQIAGMSPDVVSGYDEQGNAIISLDKGVKGLIQSYKEKNKLEQQKMAGNYSNAKQSYELDTTQAKKKLDDLQKQAEAIRKGSDNVKMAGHGPENYVSQHVKGIEELKKEIASLKNAGKPYADLEKQLKDLENQESDVNNQIKAQQGIMKQADEELNAHKLAVLQASDGYDKLTEHQRQLAGEMAKKLPDANVKDLDDIVKKLGGEDMNQLLDKFQKLQQGEGKNSVKEYNDQLKEMADQISKITGLPVDSIYKMFNKEPITMATLASKSFDETQKDIMKTMEQNKSAIKDVNTALEEHSKTGEWNMEIITKLASQGYPELLDKMAQEKLSAEDLIQVKQALLQEPFKRVNAEMTTIEQVINAYGDDVLNCANAEQAKTKIVYAEAEKRRQALVGELNQQKSMLQATSGTGTWADIMNSGDPLKALANKNYESQNNEFQRQTQSKIDEINRALGNLNGGHLDATGQQELESAQSLVDKYYKMKGLSNSTKNWASNYDKVGQSGYDGKKDKGSSSKKEKSPSEKTSYESKLDGADKYTSKLEDMNDALKRQDDVLGTIEDKIKMYKSLGDDASLAKAVEEENKLYDAQLAKTKLLQSNLDTMNNQKHAIAVDFASRWNFNGQSIENWSKSDFQNKFAQLYPTMTTTDKVYYDSYEQGKKMFNQLTDDWFKYKDAVAETEKGIIESQTRTVEILKEKYEAYFDKVQKGFDELKDKLDATKSEISLYEENENMNEKETLQSSLIQEAIKYKEEIEKTISTLKGKQVALEENGAEWNIINDKVKEYEKELRGANSEIKEAKDGLEAIQKQEYDLSSSMLDKIAETLRKRYEEAKKNELKSLEDTTNKEIELKQKQLDRLNKELKDMQDDSVSKREQLNAIKRELELWKKDDSVYARSKVRELEDEVKQREKDLAIDEKQKEIDDAEKELEAVKKNSDEKKETMEKLYEDLLSDEKIYSEANNILMYSSQEEILTMLLSYDEKYKGMGQTLGKAFSDALAKEIKNSQDALKALQDGLANLIIPEPPKPEPTPPPASSGGGGSSSGGSGAGNGGGSSSGSGGGEGTIPYRGWTLNSGNATNDETRRVQNSLNDFGYGLSVDGLWGVRTDRALADFQSKHGLAVDYDIGPLTWRQLMRYDTGGYTGEWGDSDGRIAMLHQKERVLNPEQTKAFDKLVYDVLPNFGNSNILNNITKTPSMVFNSPVVKNDIKITNNTPFDVENGLDNINRAIKNELKSSGIRLGIV